MTLVGCIQTKYIEGYQGQVHSDDEVAIVREGYAHIMTIHDEKSDALVFSTYRYHNESFFFGQDFAVKLTPGNYRIEYQACECYNYSSILGCVGPVCASRIPKLELRAGHTYKVHSGSNCTIWGKCTQAPSIWLTDETSAEVLDGTPN